jgi:hypothetical protein
MSKIKFFCEQIITFDSGNESILGVKNVNKNIVVSGLPKVSECLIMKYRKDSFHY